MSLSEKEVGQAFKTELEKQKFILVDQGLTGKTYETHFKVYLNKRVSTRSKKFKRSWQEENLDIKDIPPPQPEIDMILVDDFDILRAVELKVVKGTKRGVRPSYYIGLGQALAYLSFGFPQVAIWLCYDGNSLDDRKIDEYNDAFSKIRAPISQIVDGTYFKITREKKALQIETKVYYHSIGERRWHSGIEIPQNDKYLITIRSVNPLLDFIEPKVSKRVKRIYEFLKEQRKLWDKSS